MARGTVFGDQRGYMPDAVNIPQPRRGIRLGRRAMEDPNVLDDLGKLMREADDQLEQAKISGRINAAFHDLPQDKKIEALRAVGVDTDFTVEVRGESFQ